MYIPPVRHQQAPPPAKSQKASSIDVADKIRASSKERRNKRDRRRKQIPIPFNNRRKLTNRRLRAATQLNNQKAREPERQANSSSSADALEPSSIGRIIDVTI
jgi:hypothetical protein